MRILFRTRKMISVFLILLFCNFLSAQVNIFTESFDEATGSTTGISDEGIAWSRVCPTCINTGYFEVVNGTFENNNTDAPAIWTTDPIDISLCSRIELTIDYSGEPFPGSGNLESNDECNMNGPCIGDVNNPDIGGCFNCWDFMNFSILIDGVENNVGLIGTTNTATSFQFFYDAEDCPSVGNEAVIEVKTQTWAAAEFMRFDNVALVCFDTGGLSADLTGGGDLCGTNCTDVDWEITGGVAPYDIDLEFNLGTFNLTFTLYNASQTGSVTVCLDPSISTPYYATGSNTMFINEDFGNLAIIEITSVSDDDGCTINPNNLQVDINLLSPPTINSIPNIELCTDDSGTATVDLSNYESAVGNGNNVTWYNDPGLNNIIGPMFTTSTNTVIYAVVDDGNGCESEDIQVSIVLTVSPTLNAVMDVNSCGEYELPPINGANLVNPGYYTMPNGGGVSYQAGNIIDFNTVLFIYDEENGCSSEVSFVITISPSPDIDPINSVIECGSYILPDITGTNLGPFVAYYDVPGGFGNIFFPGDEITSSIVLYAYDSQGNCSDEELFTILISQSPELDPIGDLSACGTVELPAISGNNLTGNEAYFTQPNGGGVSYQPGEIISSSITLYVYDAIGNCVSEEVIEIEILAAPEIGVLNDVTACDFYVLPEIPFTDNGEQYSVYFSENGGVFLEGDTVFVTTFDCTFVVEYTNNPACQSTGTFDIIIEEELDLGVSDTISTCSGSEIDLYNLLGTGVTNSGTFIDVESSGAVLNDTLFTGLMSTDSLNVLYTAQNSCGADSIDLLITLVTNASAGNDQSLEICEGAIIDPSAFIDGDPGGAFYDSSTGNEIVGAIESMNMEGEIIDLIYVVGGMGNCTADTSLFTINVVTNPEFNSQPVFTTCDMFTLPTIMGVGLDGTEAYYTEPFGGGNIVPNGEAITDSIVLYLYIENEFCFAHDSLIINIGKSVTTNIDTELCPGDSIVVNGVTYDINLQAGTEELSNAAGCDSFVVVNLDFLQPDTNTISQTLCFGQSITINNTLYEESNPTGTEILTGMSSTGCDSIIMIDLEFSAAAITSVNPTICPGDSININGIFYSANNIVGTDTITLSSGCDSILDIGIEFFNVETGQYNDILCLGQSITIGGIVFDSNNPTGIAILENAAENGCDSTVTVDLVFTDGPQGNFDTIICETDEIFIEGELFNINNDQGMVTIENSGSGGCDSIVVVSLDFYEIEEGIYEETYCAGEEVELFGILFDENNPEQIVTLEGASAQNCDSTVLVSLEFDSAVEGLLMESICSGSSITIGGVTYDENNTVGQFIEQTSDGCDSIVNVMIAIEEVTAELNIFSIDCPEQFQGDEIAYVIFEGMNFISSEYLYSNMNSSGFQTIEIGDTIFYSQAGEDVLTFQTNEGCQSEITLTIEEPLPIILDLPEIVLVQEGDSYQVNLMAPSNSTIIWSPTNNISCVDCPDPIISPDVDTEYIVDVISAAGCIVSDTILLRVEDNLDIYTPNIITPDDNGINDIFFISSDTDIIYNLYIYDRWGNKMFEGLSLQSNNSQSGWDGTFNGAKVKPGVYVYYFEFNLDDTQGNKLEFRAGDITVVN